MKYQNIDIIKDLKKADITPASEGFKNHVENWLKENLFDGQKPPCSLSKKVEDFIEEFSYECQERHSKYKNFRLFVGKNGDLLEEIIDFGIAKPCSGCDKCMVKVLATVVKISDGSEVYVTSATELPYLNDEEIEQHDQIIIKSGDNHQISLNRLVYLSFTHFRGFGKALLRDAFMRCSDMVISTDFSGSELQMLHNFVMKGFLPCSEADILDGVVDADSLNIFHSFGIDLRQLLSQSPSQDTKATVQVEQKPKRKSTMPSMVELYDEGDELLEDDVADPPFVPEGTDDVDDDDEEDANDVSDDVVLTKKEPVSVSDADFKEWKSLEDMIYSHIVGEKEKGDLRCKVCDYHSKAGVIRDIARHVESRHINLTLKCPYCHIKRKDRRMFREHIRKYNTLWKFHDFSVTQILREINVEDSRSAKSADFAILGAVNFVHLVNFSLQKGQKFIKIKIQRL